MQSFCPARFSLKRGYGFRSIVVFDTARTRMILTFVQLDNATLIVRTSSDATKEEECKRCLPPCAEELSRCGNLPRAADPGAGQRPQPAGKCDARDARQWIANGGKAARPRQSSDCSRAPGECYLDGDCIEACFRETHGYSAECSSCFGAVPSCSVANGCTLLCAADSFGAECKECNTPCVETLELCTGLTDEVANGIASASDNATDQIAPAPPVGATRQNACNDFDLDAIEKWYTVYNLTFVKSIQDAWRGDAKLLAVIIVLFSGIWPYLKNIILVIIWYLPTTVENQTAVLLWLSRLSKYTLVDVFAVVGVLVGVQLQLDIGGTEAITRAEPRFGVIAFFLATVWEFLQIELVRSMHERKVLKKAAPPPPDAEERLMFDKLWVPVLMLVASLALYVSGAVTEIVRFSSTDIGSGEEPCVKSYNLVTLGNALVNEQSVTGNSVLGQTWTLYLCYVVLNLVFPILAHILQVCFIVGWFKSKKLKRLLDWTLGIWCFACIEVLLIGIFAVEYKFSSLVTKVAGDANAGFLDIDSGLGPGFYLLIVYSVVAGFLQNSLSIKLSKPRVPNF